MTQRITDSPHRPRASSINAYGHLNGYHDGHGDDDHGGHEDPVGPDPDVCRSAYKIASRVVRDMESYSQVINTAREQVIPRFDREEIVLGDLLGSGGFNNVFELFLVDLQPSTPSSSDSSSSDGNGDDDARRQRNNNNAFSEQEQHSREALAATATRDQYAVKMLQTEVMSNREDFTNGAADLMVESKILANLAHHPNIIQIHGTALSGVGGFKYGVEGCYFIVLDQLHDTLDKRLLRWQKEGSTKLMDRLLVGVSISSAMKHLHSYQIIFRDLKPDNVGFDRNGTLKLFDFGLAKELNPNEGNFDGTYEMSGQTGSRRYMAPEVALNEPYNLGADVYSFGILLWQICSMVEPFTDMSLREHMELVVKDNERPPIDKEWPSKLANILKWSWTRDVVVRPPMKEVYRALKRQCRSLAEPEIQGLAGSLLANRVASSAGLGRIPEGLDDANRRPRSNSTASNGGAKNPASFATLRKLNTQFSLSGTTSKAAAFSLTGESNDDDANDVNGADGGLPGRSRLSQVLGEALALDR
eukprot:CAMPEP_0195299234 /NCGR_PEP_ID=MMETSP0707-20130614/25131_1 /TAXON_ID=33640 /ORGANISM="Asterionellopsis glacialis, Strain CCMP134" /LENGTH=529 /DNA_ID=CAMNT_0040361575 /DNA_START=87 /DNA_END=1676 /DNA_ORIENTATION=-